MEKVAFTIDYDVFEQLVQLLKVCARERGECETCLRFAECLELWDNVVVNRVLPRPKEGGDGGSGRAEVSSL